MKRIIHNSTQIQDVVDFEHLMAIYGLADDTSGNCIGHYINEETQDLATISVSRQDANNIKLNITTVADWGGSSTKCLEFNDIDSLIDYLDSFMRKWHIEIICNTVICNPSDRKNVVNAAISTRELSKNMVRVKSSNVWSYGINIRDYKDKVGDVLTQFKGKNGGPGDIYIYYDVPVNLWRRWIGAPSKGHFFWQFIRNNFKYSKLTGNKRGVLPNAVNRR